MASRTTRAYLDAQALKLNQLTGSPTQRFKGRNPADGLQHSIGHYHINGANGGYSLVRIANESGGQHTIIEHRSAGDLADLIRYYIQGVNDALSAVSAYRPAVNEQCETYDRILAHDGTIFTAEADESPTGCVGCAFQGHKEVAGLRCSATPFCSDSSRTDGKSIIWVKA